MRHQTLVKNGAPSTTKNKRDATMKTLTVRCFRYYMAIVTTIFIRGGSNKVEIELCDGLNTHIMNMILVAAIQTARGI